MNEHLIRVLLIEDEASYALLLQEILRELSASQVELTPAHRLSEAELCLKDGQYDVILMDLSLPDGQGLDTFAGVKKLAGAIPVIVLTGSDDESLALQAVRSGAQDYVVKGQFDCRMLLRIIRYAIERQRAEEALREREEFFRLISENVHDLIAVIDRDGRRLYNSPSYRGTLADPARLAGTDSFDEIHPEDREQVKAAFQETMATGTGRGLEYRLVGRDGEVRYIESQGSTIRDALGQPGKLVVVSRDITERKQNVESLRLALTDLKRSHEELQSAQRQLIQAEKLEAISTFAGGVAHEVKNPLQVIILGVDFLNHHVVDGDPVAVSVLAEMEQAVQRADAIIRGLVEFSAYDQRDVKDVDLSAVWEQALRAVASELTPPPLRLRTELAPDLPPLRLDPKAIKHVFMTLLMQALRATGGRGDVVIRAHARALCEGDPVLTERPNRWQAGDMVVTAEIEDSGVGLLENTFVPGTDTEFARRSLRPGSALGLMVVRKIIELYGGSVDITNRPEGGAQVTLRFKATPASNL